MTIFYDIIRWNTRARIYKMSNADVWRMPKLGSGENVSGLLDRWVCRFVFRQIF